MLLEYRSSASEPKSHLMAGHSSHFSVNILLEVFVKIVDYPLQSTPTLFGTIVPSWGMILFLSIAGQNYAWLPLPLPPVAEH